MESEDRVRLRVGARESRRLEKEREREGEAECRIRCTWVRARDVGWRGRVRERAKGGTLGEATLVGKSQLVGEGVRGGVYRASAYMR
jgi:hypothetical protein